jgi:L-threonylcarbamoyladenylate synthase
LKISITDSNIVSIVSKHFKQGAIIVFPTDTCYGLGTIALKRNNESIEKIYKIKSRSSCNPLGLLITKSMISEFIDTTAKINVFLEKVWPSPLTVILHCRSDASQKLSPYLNYNNPQKLAFRVPNHEIILKIIEMVGSPIIGTSANKSGSSSKYDLLSIYQDISAHEVDVWVDAGRLTENPPSTVVDLTNPSNPTLLRKGNVKFDEISRSLL